MKTKTIIGLGTLVYFLLMPFFYHPDLKIIYYLAGFLGQGVVNIYAFIATHSEYAQLGPFVYPPASYFSVGLFQIVAKLLAGPDFQTWTAMGNDAVTTSMLFRYLWVMKLPLVLVHVATAWLLSKVADKPTDQAKLAGWWLFNPISLLVILVIGQIDGLAVLTVVAAAVLVAKKPYLAGMLLGLGGAIKTFPLLFVPLAGAVTPGSWRKKIAVMATAGLTYLAFIGPYLTTPAFYADTLASGLSQRLFVWGPGLPMLIVGIWILGWVKYRSLPTQLPGLLLLVGLIILTDINFNPQWLLWVAPWLCWWGVKHRNYFWPVVWMVGALGLVLLIPDKFLTWGLLSGFDNSVLFLPAPVTLLPSSSVTYVYLAAKGAMLVSALVMAYKTVWAKS